MLIRRATVEDWRASRDLRLRALREEPLAFASTYEREVAFADAVWQDRILGSTQLLALDGDQVVGTATGFVDPAAPAEVHLVAMYVAPEARGRGHAARLVDAVVDDARRRGFSRVVLDVVADNQAARTVYLRRGFRPTGVSHPLPHAPDLLEVELEYRLGGEDPDGRRAPPGDVGPAN